MDMRRYAYIMRHSDCLGTASQDEARFGGGESKGSSSNLTVEELECLKTKFHFDGDGNCIGLDINEVVCCSDFWFLEDVILSFTVFVLVLYTSFPRRAVWCWVTI